MAFYGYEFIEDQKENLLWNTEMALCDKQFKDGLYSYTQSNCQVTLTDNGYRIYRPPNLTVANNGNTMWGGLVLRFPNTGSTFLQQGHSYIILFDLKGKSSSSPEIYFTNQCGWGGGGLMPSPSNLSQCIHPSAFNGEMTVWYKFTINDTIWKTCTSSYSSFTQGSTYLSYRDFKYGFGYGDTGSLGTDLYLTNFRMYDITNESLTSFKVNKNGIIDLAGLTEDFPKTQITAKGDLHSNEFYEY